MTQLSAVVGAIQPGLQLAVEQVLDEFMEELKGLTAVLVASSDGFEVAARGRSSLEVSKLAAMACSISALGGMVGDESAIGQYQNVVVEADDGYVVILDIPHPEYPMILNMVATREEVLGQVLYRAKRAASRLANVF